MALDHPAPPGRISGEHTEVDSSHRAVPPAEKPVTDSEKSGVLNQTPDAATDTVPAADAGEDTTNYPKGLQLILIICALNIAIFLVALDQTIIAPALGAITAEYKSVKDIGWYGSSYLLTTTALQPMYGTIYKLFDVKLAYLGAVFIFEIGSLISGVAPTSTAFIVGRAVAGIGTAGLFSGSIVILSHIMPLEKRPIVFGLVGGMWGIASVAGPLLGGVFTDKITWRWCFYINLPIGGLAMVVIFFFVKITRPDQGQKQTVLQRIMQLDILGAALFIPAIICLLLALLWGGAEYAWSNSRIIGLFCGFAAMIAIFIGVQFWQGDKGTLPPRLFKNRNTLLAMAFAFFFGAGFFVLVYYLSLYFQAIQGVSAVQAGIKILPLMLAVVFTSILSGGLISAIGYYNAIVWPCMVLYAVGAGLITMWDVDTPMSEWFGFQVVCGLGIGAGFQVGVLIVQTVLPPDWIPVGTACVQFFQAFGGALLVSVAQTVFQNGLIKNLSEADIGIDGNVFINSGASEIKSVLEAMGRLDALDVVLDSYMVGLRHTFYCALAAAVLAFVCCLGFEWKSVKSATGDKKTANTAMHV